MVASKGNFILTKFPRFERSLEAQSSGQECCPCLHGGRVDVECGFIFQQLCISPKCAVQAIRPREQCIRIWLAEATLGVVLVAAVPERFVVGVPGKRRGILRQRHAGDEKLVPQVMIHLVGDVVGQHLIS